MKKFFVILLAGMLAATLSAQELTKAEQQKVKELKKPTIEEITKEEKVDVPMTGREILMFCTGKVLCYIPNLLIDCWDIFSLDLKGGPYAGLGFRVTRAFGLGAEGGINVGLYKDVNRQYGVAFERGGQAQFLFLTAEDVSVTNPIGTVKDYWTHGCNFPSCNDNIYKIKTGARDYWSIDAYAYVLAGAKFSLHPIEIADFITGIFFYDLKDDDIKLKIY